MKIRSTSPHRKGCSFCHWSFVLFFSLFCNFVHFALGDVGTAEGYGPPYLPTACFGNNAAKFPANNMFAAAGDGIWDNGAACGRVYLVRCLSASQLAACKAGVTIRVAIVDRRSQNGATMVLSANAFQAISNSASTINIEYQQYMPLPSTPFSTSRF